MSQFIIYTDGACSNNGKSNAKCSIGIHFSDKNDIKIKDTSKLLNVSVPTNNIAELTAVKEALLLVKKYNITSYIHIHTDSEYSINILTKWFPKWTDKEKSKKKNIPLIEEIYQLYQETPVYLHHIKAHTNKNDEHSLGNDKADKLATNALKFENTNEGILKYFK